MYKSSLTVKQTKTEQLIKVSLLSVIAFLLMFLETPLPFFPAFLQLDFSDIPAVLGAFALGPVAGVFIELIKNLLHLMLKWNAGSPVGELANFIIGTAFVLPAGWLYSHNKTRATAMKSMGAAILLMGITGGLVNYFILIPFYTKLFPLEVIIDMGNQVNSGIANLKSLILYGIVPFNILKGIVISIITLPVYKRVSNILHK